MTHTTTDRQSPMSAMTMRLVAACRDTRHHCALVLAANTGLVACGAAEPFTAALALHLVLLPFNAWRLLLALRAGRTSHTLLAATKRGDTMATRQRVASMRCPAFDATATMQTVRLCPRGALPRT